MPRTSSAVFGRPRTGRVVALVAGASLILATWAGASSAAVSKSKTTTTTAKSSHKKTTTTTAAPTTTTTTATASPADTWLIKAIGAEQKIGSVHISGNVDQKQTSFSKLSLTVNGDGEGGGTFVQDGSTIQLKRAGTLIYFNAPTKFWKGRSTKAETKAYGGKWLEVSALTTAFQSFDQFLDAADLVQAVFQGHTTPLTLSKPTTLDGHKVVIVSDTEGAKGKRTTGHLWIAATGKAVVYKIEDITSTKAKTIINFSHYAKAVSITIPPEAINLT